MKSGSIALIFLNFFLMGCWEPTWFDFYSNRTDNIDIVKDGHEKLYSHPDQVSKNKLSSDERRILIVGTNDLHGHLLPQVEQVLSDKTNNVLKDITSGGVSILKSYFDILQSLYTDEVIFLDAGDMFKGTLLSDYLKGQSTAEIINSLPYTASTLGPHDFEFGAKSSLSHEKNDHQGALKRNISKLNFPVLVSNILDIKTSEPIKWDNIKPYEIFEVNEVKVGIIGGLAKDALERININHLNGLYIQSLEQSFLKYIREMKAEGAQVIIGIVHGTGRCGEKLARENNISKHQVNFNWKTSKHCNTNDTIFKLIDKLPQGYLNALVVGEHHAKIANIYKNVPIIQSFSNGQYFGRVELIYNLKKEEIVTDKTLVYQPTKLCYQFIKSTADCYTGDPTTNPQSFVPARFLGQIVRPNLKVQELIKLKKLELQPYYQKLVSYVSKDLKYTKGVNSELPYIVGFAIQNTTKSDIGLINLKAIRKEIKKGSLTYSEIYKSLPFDHHLVQVKMKGREIRKLIEFSLKKSEEERAVYTGLKVVTGEKDGELFLKSIQLLDGRSFSEDTVYTIGTTSFLAEEGNEFYGQFFDSISKDDKLSFLDKSYRKALIDLLNAIKSDNQDLLDELIRRSTLWLITLK